MKQKALPPSAWHVRRGHLRWQGDPVVGHLDLAKSTKGYSMTRHDMTVHCVALIEMKGREKRRVTHSSALSPSFTVPSEFLSYSLLPLPLGLPAHRNPMLLAALSAEFICFVLTYTAWLKPPSLLHTQRIDRDREEEEKVKISNRYSDSDC